MRRGLADPDDRLDEEKTISGATALDKALLTPEFRFRAMKAAGDRLGSVRTVLMDISGCRTPSGEEDWDAETPLVLAACGRFDALRNQDPESDALVSRRVYKDAFSFEKADRIILEGMGTQFDPELERCYRAARPPAGGLLRRGGQGLTGRHGKAPARLLMFQRNQPKAAPPSEWEGGAQTIDKPTKGFGEA